MTDYRENLDKIPGLSDHGKEWLVSVVRAIENSMYEEMDALLIYAARLMGESNES